MVALPRGVLERARVLHQEGGMGGVPHRSRRLYATDPAQRKVHPGQNFPIASFDTFAMQSVPRWVSNDAKTQAA